MQLSGFMTARDLTNLSGRFPVLEVHAAHIKRSHFIRRINVMNSKGGHAHRISSEGTNIAGMLQAFQELSPQVLV